MKDHYTKVEVTKIPDCDLCLQQNHIEKARYDCKTTMGSWANLCEHHFENYGVGLGLGFGQELILIPNKST